MISNDILVITPAGRYADLSTRDPLCRLTLPVDRVPNHLRLPRGEAWWCEKRGARVWLRGCLQVESVREESSPDSAARRLTWDANSSTAERLTWPGTFDASRAEISALLAQHATCLSGDMWATEVTQDLSAELVQRRAVLPEMAWSFDVARTLFRRTALRGIGGRDVDELSGNLNRAKEFARHHLARAELVGLGGQDPYDVTAAILAGFTEMPVKHLAEEVSSLGVDAPDRFDFFLLDPDNIADIYKKWSRSASHTWHETLERAGRRHQEILGDLARTLIGKGLKPTYNQFVDLRIELEDHEVFFEIKSANQENFAHQARLALGQLLEYRFRAEKENGGKPVQLVAVLESISDAALIDFEREFLASTGIKLVLWDRRVREPIGLEALLDTRLSPPLPSCAVSVAH